MRMNDPSNSPGELERLYSNRVNEQAEYRMRVWKTLVRYFSRYVPSDAAVLDLGCGHGEFINNIRCRKKFAMDLNPATQRHLDLDVIFLEQDCGHRWEISDQTLDVVFSSNFFEHLPSKQALSEIVMEADRCLRRGGRLIAMGPNIRFVGGAYWDFWDHHLPLTEDSLREGLTNRKFVVEECVPKFMPFRMDNGPQYPLLFLRVYLRLPLAWKIFGKQFLVVGRK